MNFERDLEVARDINLLQRCGSKENVDSRTSIVPNFSTFSNCMPEIRRQFSVLSQRWYYADFKPEFLYHNLDFVQSYSVP